MPKIVVEIPQTCKHLVEPIAALIEQVAKLAQPSRRACDFVQVEERVAERVRAVECAALWPRAASSALSTAS